MNYTLLLYLLSISSSFFLDGSNIKREKESISIPAPHTSIFAEIPDHRYHEYFSFIDYSRDSILQSSGLSPFYEKLLALRAGQIQRVNIVQIGDSHIQPDLISREVRLGLQDFFGDAGRGLVFPYQVARTNAPLDVSSSAPSYWSSKKISQLRPSPIGISGFSLSKKNGYGRIKLFLKPNAESRNQSFDHVKLFLGNGSWSLHSLAGGPTQEIHAIGQAPFSVKEISFENQVNGFDLRSATLSPLFFGASLEKKNVPGVLFHTIGVNGARYEQYNREPLFWEQLPALNADLYILSMGTNEAFYNGMTEELYLHQVSETIANIQTINPHASILVTTAAESFKNGRSNPMFQRLNTALANYCHKMGIPLWDLFGLSGGSGSSQAWLKNHLFQGDKIHFQQKAYSMQGKLLYDALAKGYNRYLQDQGRELEQQILIKTANK